MLFLILTPLTITKVIFLLVKISCQKLSPALTAYFVNQSRFIPIVLKTEYAIWAAALPVAFASS